MTPRDVVARVVAAALLDGEWEAAAMRARAATALGRDRRGLRAIARAACARFASPPADALGELAAWVAAQPAFDRTIADRRPPIQVVRYPTPAPAMGAMPWPVPALATTGRVMGWAPTNSTSFGRRPGLAPGHARPPRR